MIAGADENHRAVAVLRAPCRKIARLIVGTGDGTGYHFCGVDSELMQLTGGDRCRVEIRHAPPQELPIDGIRRIGEQRDPIRDVLMYQIARLEHSGAVRIDGQDYDVGVLYPVSCHQEAAHGTQQ
jgi:ribosomal protein L16 Arg81 hydroxylase